MIDTKKIVGSCSCGGSIFAYYGKEGLCLSCNTHYTAAELAELPSANKAMKITKRGFVFDWNGAGLTVNIYHEGSAIPFTAHTLSAATKEEFLGFIDRWLAETIDCPTCKDMHGEDAEKCEKCEGTGIVSQIRIEVSAVPADFNTSDNACDVCESQLDESAQKVAIYQRGQHVNNLYVHKDCMGSESELKEKIKQELTFATDGDFELLTVQAQDSAPAPAQDKLQRVDVAIVYEATATYHVYVKDPEDIEEIRAAMQKVDAGDFDSENASEALGDVFNDAVEKLELDACQTVPDDELDDDDRQEIAKLSKKEGDQ